MKYYTTENRELDREKIKYFLSILSEESSCQIYETLEKYYSERKINRTEDDLIDAILEQTDSNNIENFFSELF